jgi:nitrogen fixation NifU-like protein
LCGDSLTLWVKLENDAIADVSFKGQGCAISKASASLMTAAVKGKTRAEAEDLFDRFHQLVTGTLPESEQQSLGSLRALGGVSRFPLRVKCASLAWHALHSALASNETEVSTEHEGPEGPPLEGA